MLIVQAIILGIVQGLTEFIPISSSAHLIIVPWLLGWNDPTLDSLAFDVALHLGTVLAVLAFFASDWVRLIRGFMTSIVEWKIGDGPERRLAWFIVIGSLPGAIAGVLAESKIEELFHQPNTAVASLAIIVMAIIIALLGAALYVAERMARHLRGLQQVTLRDAILIGLAQALAVFPGVSRSGSTITAGLACGLQRPAAARFSFLLSAPIIAGAGLKSVLAVYGQFKAGTLPGGGLTLFAVGFIAAAITGYLTIKFLLSFLQRNSTDLFVYYRWALAIFLIVVALLRG